MTRYDADKIRAFMETSPKRTSTGRWEIWMLYFERGKSAPEIAGELGLTVAAVRRRIYTLRAAARKWRSQRT